MLSHPAGLAAAGCSKDANAGDRVGNSERKPLVPGSQYSHGMEGDGLGLGVLPAGHLFRPSFQEIHGEFDWEYAARFAVRVTKRKVSEKLKVTYVKRLQMPRTPFSIATG